MRLSGWTREPLVHFLLAGFLIYLFFALRGEEVDPASRVIDVDRETQAQIALGFERLMSRPPTDSELDAQIDRYVREEVLYREALRLGLDQDDAIVRRRMAQKMDLLAGAQAETERAPEETLRQWYVTHPERFTNETRYTFDQLWFPSEDAALAARKRLQSGADWSGVGQRISLPRSLEGEERGEVLDSFGEQFVAALDRLQPGPKWQGPVISGFGWHIIRLSGREVGAVPKFEDIRADVENDWRSATIAERRERGFDILREAYRVEIEH